jgi:ankyrin repeat protein
MDSPFFAAFNWKRYKVAEWFLENSADVNFADSKGNTALFYAVKRKLKTEEIEMLLRFNADFNKVNNEGISPKSLAEANRQKKILEMFGK